MQGAKVLHRFPHTYIAILYACIIYIRMYVCTDMYVNGNATHAIYQTHRYALAERCWDADPQLRPSFNTLATEISNMIPDYDPNQYVEIARYSPYCQMYSSDNNTLQKNDSEKPLASLDDSSQNDS